MRQKFGFVFFGKFVGLVQVEELQGLQVFKWSGIRFLSGIFQGVFLGYLILRFEDLVFIFFK